MKDRANIERVKDALASLGAAELLRRLGRTEGRPEGQGMMDLCPAHAERTPSCHVAPRRDGRLGFTCFGCGQGGDVLVYIALVERLDPKTQFQEILRRAADLAGISVEESKHRPHAAAAGAAPAMPRSRRATASARRPLLPAEVAAFYAHCTPVYDDPEVASALRARGIDPALVVDRDLARALPAAQSASNRGSTSALPYWARYRGAAPVPRTWAETGHRLIIPMYDAKGDMVTLRARRIVESELPKALPPAGHAIPPAVMADPLGRLLLSTGERPDWWNASRPLVVILSEGEPDFLTVATHYGDDECAPAVLGITGSGRRLRPSGPRAGTWSAELAARIPAGCHVVIRSHLDEAGDDYAAAIAETLHTRCPLFRRSQ